MQADIQFKPRRPTVRQWVKALVFGLFDADAASNTGIPPDGYDPRADCKARAVLIDAGDVVWATEWTADVSRANADRDRIAALLTDLGDDEARRRAKSGTLVPDT